MLAAAVAVAVYCFLLGLEVLEASAEEAAVVIIIILAEHLAHLEDLLQAAAAAETVA
jgi:hypothetical protein